MLIDALDSVFNRLITGVIRWTYGNIILAKMERSPGEP